MVTEHCPEAGHSSGFSICFTRCSALHRISDWTACSGILYIVYYRVLDCVVVRLRS